MAVFRIPRIRRICTGKFLGLPYSLVKGRDRDPDPSNIKQNSKNNLISSVL